jgi:uncharacterized membrane protein YccF (DUF307 family)
VSERFKDRWYKWKWIGSLLWGMPFVAVGLLLFATIFLSPLGLIAWTIAAYPLQRTEMTHMRRKRAWKDRDQPMPNSNQAPWLIDDDEPDA